MTENEVKQGINAITSQSPIQQQIQAIHNMQFPKEEDGQSTLVTGDIEGKVADQIVSSPDRGVEFTPDTTEVYTGGVASPKGAYNTRRQTAEDMGNPLYFEPNYQAVAPYTFDTPAGPVQATTLDLKKLNWQIASTNGLFDDRKYIGYIPVPDVGRLSWWSHVVGGTKGTIATLPLTMAKGLTNTVATGTKVGTWLMSPAINTAVDLANANPQSIVSDVVKGMAFGTDPDHPTGIIMDTMNNMMDIVDNAVSPEEKSLMRSFNADPDDTSFRARSAQGVGSGVTSFLTAWFSGHPELAFTFMNFANTNQMRHQALDAGVSPMWAELYAAGGSTVNTALDMAQVEVLFGGAAISASSALDYLKNLSRSGLYKFGNRLVRAGEKAAVEGGIEMVQETVEGVFDPDFIEDPVDRLAIAGLAGVALGAIGLPIEVLQAPAAEKAKVAKALGVLGQYNNVRDLAVNLVDGWAKEGRIDPSQKEQLIDMIMTEAPQQVIRDLRAGVKGQLDKIPMEDRMAFAKTLQTLEDANKNNLFTPEKIEALDKEVDTALVNVRAGMPDSEVTMIKGLVRGAYVVANIAHAGDPNFQFSVPKFIIATNKDGYSYYDPKKNTIGVHGSRSDTVNTNTPQQYASQVVSGFRRATEISDRMASILHEMSHWLDHMVGQKGFGDFLEHYYNDIAKVFGEEKAQEMYDASNGGVNRVSTKKQKGKSTEQHAQAVARLGKRAAESFGLGRSQANRFLSYANLVLNQMKGLEGEGGEKMAQWIDAYQEAVQKITRDNMELLNDLIEVYGSDAIKEAIRDFSSEGKYHYEDFAQYLAHKNMLRDLYNVLDSFADAAGTQKINDLFEGDQTAMGNFVTMGDKMFRNGYDSAVEEVRQRRQDAKNKAEGKKKPVEAKADKDAVVTGDGVVMSKTNDKIDASDMPTFFDDKSVEHEEVDTWHGTPHRFDEFDTSKAHTGEGGNTHGWGVYLTTLKDRAKRYWHNLLLANGELPLYAKVTYEDGSTENINVLKDWRLSQYFDGLDGIMYNNTSSDKNNALWYSGYKLINEEGGYNAVNDSARYLMSGFRADIEERSNKEIKQIELELDNKEVGQLVKAKTPDTEKMLNAEKYVKDQNDYIKDILSKNRGYIIRRLQQYYAGDIYGYTEQQIQENIEQDMKWYDDAYGEDVYNVLSRAFGTPEGASRFLSRNGIYGIEYNGNQDGRSFVVFDPETIKMIDIYKNAKDIIEAEEGSAGQMQDWAKAALGAKESVKQSFESAKETKQIPADKQIDGRNLTDDINIASNGLSKRVAQPMNKFVKWASSSKWGWGLDRILITILGRDAAEKFDVAGKYSAKQAARTRYWDEFQQRLESLFGEKDKTKFMFKYKTMVTDLGFVRMNNVEMINPANTALSFKRNITGWEAMYVYLMDRQGYGARVQKSTTTNIKDIIALLSPEEKSFADAMSDQLMDMYKRTFKEGSKYENYFPIQSAEHELYNELSIDSLTARQKTDDAIAIIDAGRVFSQYVSRWASHESGYFETLKRLRDVFGYRGVSANEAGPGYIFNADEEESRIKASAQVAATVRQVLGNDGYDNLMNNINSEIQDKQELLFDKSRQNVLTQLGNNIMKSILANKVISFPKNAVNMMMMFGGAKDQSLYWNSFAEGWAKPKETYNYMMEHSHEIKQRWGTAGGINEYLDQRTLGGNTAPAMKAVSKAFANMKWDSDKTNNMAKFSAVMDMLGDAGLKLFMQSGDMIANVYGGYGLIKDYIAQGMTEEEAFKKLDRYIIEHQSSSNLAMKPLIQKEHMGDFLGQVFAFTSEGVAKWASIMGTFDEVNMGTATRSEAITNAASIAISMALYSILAAGAWDLLSDDEKVQEDTQKALVNTVIDQVFGGMVAGNALISPMISYMIGDTRLSGMSTPFYNYAIDAGTALKKGNYFEAWLKAQSALGLPIGADNAWNSMLGISLLTDPNPQVREAGKLMMMGYTKNRAAKRAGIDKETIENSGEE